MEIYNENMERIESPDLSLGWLEESMRVQHHDAVDGVEEEWHYETVMEYPNGGKDVRKIIDVPGVEAKHAWDEVIDIRIYHPYTQEELDAMNGQTNSRTVEERVKELEEAMELLLSGVTE